MDILKPERFERDAEVERLRAEVGRLRQSVIAIRVLANSLICSIERADLGNVHHITDVRACANELRQDLRDKQEGSRCERYGCGNRQDPATMTDEDYMTSSGDHRTRLICDTCAALNEGGACDG
jgi:hypothetical protein